ncbi:MAG: FecR family protein [gamma proteobacterium symbiont of Taylorina sp.]|nr:FecR family protein [gamma proteobacterium symbiont of Taylorina sp.]
MKINQNRKWFIYIRQYFLLIIYLSLWSAGSVYAEPIGEMVLTKGVVSLNLENNTIKVLGQGDKLEIGDLISIGDDSKAILKLIDGTKISLIENTEFMVKVLSMEKNKKTVDLQLLKGGIRAIAGQLKGKSTDLKLTTPVANVDIRGADFSGYLCDTHCEDEKIKAVNKNKIMKVNTVVKARVLVKKGQVSAKNKHNDLRELYKESPLYKGDTLMTANKSFALVVFKDDSRTTVQANSEFLINDYQYKPKKAAENRADLKLIKGSMRFLTGKIGKLNRDKYAISTPISSIGIRGTGFDLAYTNPTYLYLWQGTVDFVYPKGILRVNEGRTYFLADKNSIPKLIKRMPKKFQTGPRPDDDEVSEQIDLLYLFGSRDIDGRPGLYLNVKYGEIKAENRLVQLNLGSRETGYIGADSAYRVTTVPGFLVEEFLPPDADKKVIRRINILSDFDNITYRDNGNICEISE